jgi:hypothetical protein
MKKDPRRTSRLAVRPCPSCLGDTLVSNGAWWRCDVCEYAVTSMAIVKDLQYIETHEEEETEENMVGRIRALHRAGSSLVPTPITQ